MFQIVYFNAEGRSEGNKLRKRSKDRQQRWGMENKEDERSRICLMKVKLGWG